MKAFWHSNFIIQLRSWEYWPWYIVYFPVILYWLWLSFRARSFFFFSAANPGMLCGGLFGESKKKILDLLPKKHVPTTLLFNPKIAMSDLVGELKRNNLHFPVIAKPDIGERGVLVEKITDETALQIYVDAAQYKFQIQEYVKGPYELGIFYYRYPQSKSGVISSVVIKEMLTVIGDGVSSLQQLIQKNDRAKLQLKSLSSRMDMTEVLPLNSKKELVSIGNHCRGTTFLNGQSYINEKLVRVFDEIHQQMSGNFFYGRFDLRCSSLEDLYNGNFKVVELNGAAAEPAHIYHPGFSMIRAYEILFHHWKTLFTISVENHRLGIPYIPSSLGWKIFRSHFKSDKYSSGQLG